MKKILVLVLALLMCSFVFSACDDPAPAEPQGTTAESDGTTTEQPSETEEQPSAPIKIDNLNGKTPKQLYADLSNQFPTFTSFEYSIKDGDSNYIMKVSGKNSYFWTDVEGTIECTIVDEVGYLNDAGEKLKYVGQTLIENELDDYIPYGWIEYELFGEDFVNHISFDGVEMYRFGNECYFTFTVTEGDEIAEFTVHFDKDGVLTSFLATESEDTIKFSNINKPVEITVPEDIDTYPEYDPIDNRGLELYKQLCQKLSEATVYSVRCQTFNYSIDNDGDECLTPMIHTVVNGGDVYRNGDTYYKQGEQYFSKTGEAIDNPTEDIVALFAEAKACAANVDAEVEEAKIAKLTMYVSDKTRISVRIRNTAEYTYSFDEDMEQIEVNIYIWNPTRSESTYTFGRVNSDIFDVKIPTVG